MLMLNEENFQKEVAQSNQPVIVDFFADWCGPCKMVAPVFEKVSQTLTHIKFAKMNVDSSTALAHDQGVMGIPCMIVYKNGEEVDRIVGYQPEHELKKKIEAAIAK